MANLPNVGGVFLETGDISQEVQVIDVLERCDMLLQSIVINATLSAPPGSPAEGDRHIISGTPTGLWASGSDKDMAVFFSGSWVLLTPDEGWKAYDQDTNKTLLYDGSTWADIAAPDVDMTSATIDISLDTNLTKAVHGRSFIHNDSMGSTKTLTLPNNDATHEGVWFEFTRRDTANNFYVDPLGTDWLEIPNALGTFTSLKHRTSARYDSCRWTLISGRWRASGVIGTWVT